jgi:hypothetical protein
MRILNDMAAFHSDIELGCHQRMIARFWILNNQRRITEMCWKTCMPLVVRELIKRTEDQAEELRRRARAPSRFREGRRPS